MDLKKLRFFGINTIQNENFSLDTNADDKLKAVSEYFLSRHRRKESDKAVSALEKSAFASADSSLGWIETVASPLCSFYASYLKQKAPAVQEHNLVKQTDILRKLKKLGGTILYLRPADKKGYCLSVLVSADASRVDDAGQLGIVTGLLVGEMSTNAICHVVSRVSHKAKRPVKSIPAAEFLAAAESIDEGKAISKAYLELLGRDVG